jgi:hypothetical protein
MKRSTDQAPSPLFLIRLERPHFIVAVIVKAAGVAEFVGMTSLRRFCSSTIGATKDRQVRVPQ